MLRALVCVSEQVSMALEEGLERRRDKFEVLNVNLSYFIFYQISVQSKGFLTTANQTIQYERVSNGFIFDTIPLNITRQ